MTVYNLVSCTIGGVPLPIKNARFDAVVNETEHRFSHGKYTVECTAMIKGKDAADLLAFFQPRIRGATDATLARRVRYGGRKGRSALRRLLAKGFVGIMTVNDSPPMPLPPFRLTTPTKASAPSNRLDAPCGARA